MTVIDPPRPLEMPADPFVAEPEPEEAEYEFRQTLLEESYRLDRDHELCHVAPGLLPGIPGHAEALCGRLVTDNDALPELRAKAGRCVSCKRPVCLACLERWANAPR